MSEPLTPLWEPAVPSAPGLRTHFGYLPAEDLVTALRADQARRWRAGEHLAAEVYLDTFPELAAEPEDALVLICGEVLLRRETGAPPSLAEFQQRFPHLAEPLAVQFELQRVLADATGETGDSRTEAIPFSVPGYEVLGELGRGGMGVVYKARQLALDRLVALKVILAGAHADAEQQRRFRAEAEAVARLCHPNFVQVYDSGVGGRWPYLVLEFVEGGTLAQKVAGNPQPPRAAAQIVETLAAAMQHAHRAGLVHRDLKPANVLLTEDGVSKITDFGLVKRLPGELGVSTPGGNTQSGALVGTPAYMAPEQVSASRDAVGPAADTYALGVILYELLTGRPPFQGDSVLEVLRQVQEQEPQPPSRLRRSVPRDLETICLKCLQKEPAQRYATAAALAEDLRRFQAGEPIAARPVGTPERVWRWCRRNPGWAAMLATVAGLLVAIAGVASGLSVWALRAERAARRQLLDAKLEQARATRSSQLPGQRFGALRLLDDAGGLARELNLPAARFLDLRNATIAALAVPDLHPQPTAVPFPADAVGADFDADFSLCARGHTDGSCRILRVADGAELHHIPGLGLEKDNASPYLSRDGRFVAVAHQDGRVRLWRLDGAKPERLFEEPHPVSWIDFDAASRHVAFAHTDGRISRYELAHGRRINHLAPDALSGDVKIALHPDPARPLAAVCSYRGGGVQVRNLETGAVEKRLELPGRPARAAWHPRGDTLAVGDGDVPNTYLFDGTTWERRRTLANVSGSVYLTFNHAGTCLAASDWGGAVQLVDPATGQHLFQTPGVQFWGIPRRFSRDDRRLAGFVTDGRLGVWEVGEPRAYRALVRPDVPSGVSYGTPALSPDGRLLAVLMSDGVGFWDLEAGRWLELLKLDRPRFVHFAPDGAMLLGDESGTYRWPLRRDPAPLGRGLQTAPQRRMTAPQRRFGPPEALALPPGDAVGQSNDGRVLAVGSRRAGAIESWAGTWVLHADRPDTPDSLDVGEDIGTLALSPDGRWLVTASHTGETVHLWDMQLGGLPRKLLDHGLSPTFSPDGRRLLVAGAPGGLFDVETWQRLRDVDHAARFSPDSPDGQTLVQRTSTHILRLVETDTGRELAQLEAPGLIGATYFLFTPDGTRLVTVHQGRGVHVWDLRLLREELARRGLDWDAPAYGPARPPGEPLRVAFDWGNFDELRPKQRAANFDRAVAAGPKLPTRWLLRGRFHWKEGRPEEALADLRKAVEVAPKSPLCCNSLAWFLTTGPEHLRDAGQAVELAERAVKGRPGSWTYHNTRGVAYYRAERYADAVAALTQSLAGTEERLSAFDLYFLAMCHHRLGDAARARERFEQARTRHEQHAGRLLPDEVEELRCFRVEAAALLGQPSGE